MKEAVLVRKGKGREGRRMGRNPCFSPLQSTVTSGIGSDAKASSYANDER